ncbi:hypothetical protein JCM11641_005763 [Rhodosporidiobolus odoratus]
MASHGDSPPLIGLRVLTAFLGGVTLGLATSGPLLALPALFTSPGLSSRSRLHFWSRLHQETTTLSSLLLPLLTACLAGCALLARSHGEADALQPVLTTLIASNRKSLFTIAAVFILALRPYSFGLLAPRVELLKNEERRLLLQRDPGSLAALGLGKGQWRGASPAGSHAGHETDAEDSGSDETEAEDGSLNGKRCKVDTDALIRELSRIQLGTVFLAGSAFLLTILELLCA